MTTEQLAKVCKALSNENRLEIFLGLCKNNEDELKAHCDCPVASIMQKLHIGAPTISHHLKELSNAGLIKTKREGKYLMAHVNQDLLNEVINALGNAKQNQ